MTKSSLKLEKNESIYLEDDKIYTILSGKVTVRDIFSNGKVVNSEMPLANGDIIGNFFKICNVYQTITKDIAIEIEAMEDTILLINSTEELLKNLKNDNFGMLKNLIEQMLKKHLITICHHTYSKKGYVLAVLLLHSDEMGNIPKEMLSHEIFNLSRSQFFAAMSELKNDLLVNKTSKGVKIDKIEAEKYLELEV